MFIYLILFPLTMLKEQIEELRNGMMSKAPEEVLTVMQGASQKLIESGIAEKSLKKGDKAPEFSLPNVNNENVSSSELISKGPLIINFYRGGWCPFCSLEIVEWQRLYPKIQKAGAEFVSISPNILSKSAQTKSKYRLSFNILSDLGNKVAKKFGLVFALPRELRSIYKEFGINIPEDNGDDTFEIPIPATYIIKDGIIAYSFVDADYTKRAEPSEVLEVLKNLK